MEPVERPGSASDDDAAAAELDPLSVVMARRTVVVWAWGSNEAYARRALEWARQAIAHERRQVVGVVGLAVGVPASAADRGPYAGRPVVASGKGFEREWAAYLPIEAVAS